MSLRNQPYLPLYIQDFLTDEKLNECSAESTGVYIRLMCLMHKSEYYGKILLKQKDKQTFEQINNFALKLARLMPYSYDVIFNSLNELLDEQVIRIEDDFLVQKRMVKDNDISEKRSISGKKGGIFAQAKVKAKVEANSEYENEYKSSVLEKAVMEEKAVKAVVGNTVTKEKGKKVKKTEPDIPESLQSVIEYFKSKGENENSAKIFFEFYEEAKPKWHSKGEPILSWKQKAITWISHNKGNNSNQVQQQTKTLFDDSRRPERQRIVPSWNFGDREDTPASN